MNAVKPKNNWSILTSLKSGLKNPSDVNNLANYCLAISKSYLKTKFDNIYKLEYYEQYSSEEIALDSIVPLFEKNKESGDYVIIRSFNIWRNPIENETQADYFIHKVVWNRTEQQITKIYKEVDPFFAKILDSLKYIIKKEGFVKKSHFGKILILKDENNSLSSIIDKENFDEIPVNIFDGKTENIIKKIFNYLENYTEFSIAIPINLLVKRIKVLKLNEFLQSEIEEVQDLYDDSFNAEKIIESGLEKIDIVINTVYLKLNRFSNDECSKFKNILTNYAADLSNGGIHKSVYEYFLELDPTLTSEDFYSKYQYALYYLMRELKKNISEKLKLLSC
ncbi:MAG: hypothetical protein WAR79_10280 [Melioribacteraceae bacterium]